MPPEKKTIDLKFHKFLYCTLTPGGIETVVEVKMPDGSIERRILGPYPLQVPQRRSFDGQPKP